MLGTEPATPRWMYVLNSRVLRRLEVTSDSRHILDTAWSECLRRRKQEAFPLNSARSIHFIILLQSALTKFLLYLNLLPLSHSPTTAQVSSSPAVPWSSLLPGLLPLVLPLQSIPHPGPRRIPESSHVPPLLIHPAWLPIAVLRKSQLLSWSSSPFRLQPPPSSPVLPSPSSPIE